MLPDEARPWGIALRVKEIEETSRFYQEELGLKRVREEEGIALLEAKGSRARIQLESNPMAPSRSLGTEGLFHMAFLVPTRKDLARALRSFIDKETTVVGAADHGVSEAVYLEDPEGNGIEVYRDRPPSEWPRRGEEVAMVTDPLDTEDLLGLADEPSELPEGTELGHVHLETMDLERASRFYEQVGLRVTQTSYPGARFLATGSYHHHVGLNRWNARQRRQEQATGLESVTWRLPTGALPEVLPALQGEGLSPRQREDALVLEDPMGVGLRLVEAGFEAQ